MTPPTDTRHPTPDNPQLAAVWLPEQARRVLILDIETDEQVLPRVILSEAAAVCLVDQLLRGLGALQRLPGGCPLPTGEDPSQ